VGLARLGPSVKHWSTCYDIVSFTFTQSAYQEHWSSLRRIFEYGSGDSNTPARVVTLSPKFCHITPVLANLHWLPIDLRIEFKILTVTYKTLHGLAPTHIKDLLQSYLPAGDLRSSKKNLPSVRAFNINSYGRRTFSVATSLPSFPAFYIIGVCSTFASRVAQWSCDK